MLAYTIRRLLLTIPVMLLVATGVFLLLRLTPGDPAGIILGPDATEERRMELRRELGLEDPLPLQYVRWLGRTVQGDLGRSLFLDKPVTAALLERAQPTLLLTTLALLVAVSIGLPTGIIAARARGSWLDLGSMGFAMIGIAMPTFWLGLNLILIFAVLLRWLPVAGYEPLSKGPWQALRYLILPALTLGVAQGALLARMTRSMMLEVLGQDYVRTARAKGLAERGVILRHALRNAFIPLMTVIGLTFAALMGGAVVTEQIFNIPGVGRLLIQAIGRRDFPLVQGTVLVIAAFYVLINLAVDLLYAVVDPRIRHA
ncbi:MAG: ABC transporter, permease protein 1 (cluster 5, nickel/peptides/opines) [uncultured Thermomicrobiales bacterium]|uniref:ABC transporter, permease protein 1 (Cluster 5, nickel/peptides/opines) n=1 Tax=uncultured Thermomicrobiales bacterium TaxID=1645740 RepID=A0A6J4VS19_9BACT|nr:MAG: ABC transporter, permease protein 1 (cluster 5, nickel/peptides/opines) [uncultured Thermomicrobiales bacterium]